MLTRACSPMVRREDQHRSMWGAATAVTEITNVRYRCQDMQTKEMQPIPDPVPQHTGIPARNRRVRGHRRWSVVARMSRSGPAHSGTTRHRNRRSRGRTGSVQGHFLSIRSAHPADRMPKLGLAPSEWDLYRGAGRPVGFWCVDLEVVDTRASFGVLICGSGPAD